MKARTVALALMAALLLLAAGCGGGNGGSASSAPDPAAATDAAPDAGTDAGTDGGTDGAEPTAEPAGQGEAERATLTLNWVPYGEHAPFYYGLAQGIFEEEGIRLTIQPGGGSGRTVQQVGAGLTDFGWADTPAVLNGVASGLPVKSVGVFLQTTPGSIEFFAEKGYTEPADLAGQTIGGTAGDAMSQTFPAFLAANGLSEGDVTVQNVDAAGKIAALVEGRVDAIMGFCHDQAPTIRSISGKDVECMRFSDWGVNFFSTGLITSDELIEQNPGLVEAMLRATIRSFEAARENPEAAVAAMHEAVFNQAPAEEVLLEQFTLSLELWHTERTEGMRPGVNDVEDWQDTIDVFAEHGSLEDAQDPSAYWTDQFAPAS